MKKLNSWRALEESRRHQYWRAALVGLLAGGIALFFQKLLQISEGLRENLLVYLHLEHSAWGWIVLPVIAGGIGAFVGWMTSRFAPETAGSGIPHVKAVLLHASQMSWKRVMPVKFIGGVLAIGTGFSLGREGPTVQMGAAMGKFLADILKVPPKATPRLEACGAGAGLAAAFHAPLAGFIFTVEELQREFSSLTYAMALIAAVVADIVTTSFWGTANAFHATGFDHLPMSALPLCVVVGLVAGLTGTAFNKGLLWMQEMVRQKVHLLPWQRAGLIGVFVGLIAWWLPELAGGGHNVAQSLLHAGDVHPSVQFLLILFVGKFLLTLLSYMAGVPGGIFAPMLLMGASLGILFGTATSSIAPWIVEEPAAMAAIGMAAFFAAVVRAPLTGVVLVLQMTSDWNQLLALLTAAMVAYLVSEKLKVEPIYEALTAVEVGRAKPDIPMQREPILLEFLVQEESQMDGKAIKDLPLPERCLFVTITRHGEDLLPSGLTTLHRGDHITAVLSGADPSASIVRVLALSKA
ncbi:MAG: H(+)/Cl(-) exchange transporter ClcA [Candidatus Hydrogenedentes bacterium]|nr:H(+)/Cl(-) exchange transporter ClcA [Candidatus Hydrogenedentota bacterium]